MVEVRIKNRGVHPCVGSSASNGFDFLAGEGGKGFIEAFLDGDGVGLNLPAVVVRAFVSQFDKGAGHVQR